MNKIITVLFLTFICFNIFGQNATELNQQSKILINQQKFDEAIPILKQAAELGNAEAQYNLGYIYQSGIGVEKDNVKAVKWFSQSADQGFIDGQYQMMMAYGTGNGVSQDFKKAFSYGLKCAKYGDETCMFNVLNCYKEGMGTEKDIDKMLEWAVRLGKLENPENLQKSGYITSARLNLAYLFKDGIDVEADLFKSYQWFIIYNEFKTDFSYIQQQQIVKEIQDLEKKLTDNQKANAQKEAEKILERSIMNMENLYKAEL